MTKIVNDRFNGGLAEGRYDKRSNVALDMYHYDAFTDPTVLHNHRANQKDTYNGVNENVYVYDASVRSNGTYIGLGNDRSSPQKCIFYRKNNTDLNSYWSPSVVDAAPSTSYTPFYNGTFAFQTYVYGLCWTSGGATVSLYRYEGDANATSMGTFSPTVAATTIPRVTVHSQDATAYIAIGKTISKFTGTTITANVLTLPYTILSTCEYGLYLAILCVTDAGKGIVYLWGRNTAITTLQELYIAGDDSPKYMYNINGRLIVVSASINSGSSSNYFLWTRITARVLNGGVFTVLRSVPIQDSYPRFETYTYTTWKDTGYFLDYNNAQVYAVGFNQNGEFYITKDRSGRYDGESAYACRNFFNLGDYFGFSLVDGAGAVRISYNGQDLYSTIDSYWKTTANPGMYQQAPQDIPKIKQVKRVWARFYTTNAGYGTATMKITLDNNAEATIFSESAPSGKNNFTIEATTLTSGDQIGSGRDLIFKIITDQGIDLVDYGYEYDPEDSQAG
jgi:hypothetical protein